MENEKADIDALRLIKHDIKNQLSNIHLALETIRYEISTPTEDFNFCIETIAASASKIDALIKKLP
jgi:nitrogen fixation/metabolism regulation signal transduction histidine kinase